MSRHCYLIVAFVETAKENAFLLLLLPVFFLFDMMACVVFQWKLEREEI